MIKLQMGRLWRESWRGIRKNLMLLVSAWLAIFVISFFYNILQGVDFFVSRGLDDLSHRVDIIIELDNRVSIHDPIIDYLSSDLQKQGLQVTKIPKEKALKDFIGAVHPDLAQFLEKYQQNPLPDALYVTAQNLDAYTLVDGVLKQDKYRKLVNYESNESGFVAQKDRIVRLIEVTHFVRLTILILGLFFVVVVFSVIFNALRFLTIIKGREIKIMRLVGAERWYMTGPFYLQAFVLALVGVLSGILLYVGLTYLLVFNIATYFPNYALGGMMQRLGQYTFNDGLWSVLKQVLLFGGVALASSWLAMRKILVDPRSK